MVDRDLIAAKAGTIRRHLSRVGAKRGESPEIFLGDSDRQDIVSFNLQLAIQGCIDVAAHIVSEEGLGVPGSISEMFYLLEENGYISDQLTEKMVRAVGLRNLLVHEYGKLDLMQVFEISQRHLGDLREYLVAILNKTGISME